MAKLILKNLSTTAAAGGRVAPELRELSLEVRDRELFVLTGPDPRELSSVLRAIGGLQPISRGEIVIGDRPVHELAARDRDVAMVFRSYALYPNLTLFANLALGMNRRGFPKAEIEKRVKQAASMLGFEKLLNDKPTGLSGAESLRVALGRAVVRQPKAYLLEDPLGGVEPLQRAAMRTELLKLQQRLQATMICTTADPVEAMALGDRVAVLKDGALRQVDTPVKIYAEPADVFVAGFLGAPPINFIRGRLRPAPAGFLFKESEGGTLELPLEKRGDLEGWAGRDLILGIRPEDLRIVQNAGKPGAVRFQGLVDAIESLGGETLCTVATGAHTIVSRSFANLDRSQAGHRMQFDIDASKALLFDPETTRRI